MLYSVAGLSADFIILDYNCSRGKACFGQQPPSWFQTWDRFCLRKQKKKQKKSAREKSALNLSTLYNILDNTYSSFVLNTDYKIVWLDMIEFQLDYLCQSRISRLLPLLLKIIFKFKIINTSRNNIPAKRNDWIRGAIEYLNYLNYFLYKKNSLKFATISLAFIWLSSDVQLFIIKITLDFLLALCVQHSRKRKIK